MHDLALGGLAEQLDHPLGQVAAGVEALDGVGQGVALVNRHGVRDAVAGVERAAGGAAGRVLVVEDGGLDLHVQVRVVEGLEVALGHARGLPRVERGLGEHDSVVE